MSQYIGRSPAFAMGVPSNLVFSSLVQRERPHRPSRSYRCPSPSKYGDRAERKRWVDQLKPWQVDDLRDADILATTLGVPLNRFITIYWAGTAAGISKMQRYFARGMKRMGQWFRLKKIPFAYVYTHENPEDRKPNTHILIHLPKALLTEFRAKIPRWFGEELDGAIRIDARNDKWRLSKGLPGRLEYMIKGAQWTTCRAHGAYRTRGGQGPIHFKRSGVATYLTEKPWTTKAATKLSGVGNVQ